MLPIKVPRIASWWRNSLRRRIELAKRFRYEIVACTLRYPIENACRELPEHLPENESGSLFLVISNDFRLPDVFFTDDFHEAFTINVDLILCVLMRTEGLVDQANRYLHVNCTFLQTILTFGVRSRKICEMIRLGRYENWKRKFKSLSSSEDCLSNSVATVPG